MSDVENGNGASNEGGEVQVNIIGQYLKDLSFESPAAPEAFRNPGENPNGKIDVDVGYTSIGEKQYESTIKLKVTFKTDTGPIYIVEVTYAGAVEIQSLPKEHLEPFLLIELPTLIFPFVRRLVSDVTQEGGFAPARLDPINFGLLYQQRLAQQKANN